jgi:hypothetical protein
VIVESCKQVEMPVDQSGRGTGRDGRLINVSVVLSAEAGGGMTDE